MYAEGLQLIQISEDRVVLKRGLQELLLTGAGSREFLETLIRMLDGTRSREQILAAFAADVRSTADQLLTTLLRRGLASEHPGEIESRAAGDGLLAAFYRNFLPASKNAAGRLSQATVLVAGVNLISRSLVRGLLECGTGKVLLVDLPVLSNSVSPFRWLDQLAAERHEGRITLCQELPDPAALADVSLLCATSDFGEADTLYQLNRLALSVEKPFLPIWLADLLGHVGPLTYPFETACLRCYRLRADSNDDGWEVKRAIREVVAADGEARTATGLASPMPAILGEIAAMEVLKTVGELVPGDVVGRQIEINLMSFRSAVRRVLKVPRCPDCSEQTRKAPMAITRGPQIARSA